jgi:hypothetical protein
MLKGITIASLTMLLSSIGSMVIAQTNVKPIPNENVILGNPVRIRPVGQSAPQKPLMKPSFNNRPTEQTLVKPSARPYPAGTPCGATVVNGQNVFVNPQPISGSYCDRDGNLQYR